MIIGNHRFIIPIILLVSPRGGLSLDDTTDQSLLEPEKYGTRSEDDGTSIVHIRGRRNLKMKAKKSQEWGKASKGNKSQKKSAKSSSKPVKSSKGTKSQGSLIADIDQASATRDAIRVLYKYDVDDADMCEQASDQHQHCVYHVFKAGGYGFECECRPTDGAKIFGEVDSNDDLFITWEEIIAYFDSKPCVFPFKYTKDDGSVGEYTSCTTVDDSQEWCSIDVLNDGFHATGFFKYCVESVNLAVWNDAIFRLDEDNDGKLSFHEAITSARERRRRERQLILAGSESTCEDCVKPDYCSNPAIMAIDNHCRNFIKTKPLGDDETLQILATAMLDVYCDEEDAVNLAYNSCPMKRERMSDWLTRTHLEPYQKEKVFALTSALVCLAMAVSDTVSSLVNLHNGAMYLGGGSPLDCSELFDMENFDGKDALQWSTYTIMQGGHEGKKVLAFQGTDPSNLEQILADIWSVPLATDMMRNMRKEAVAVAKEQNPHFITGHSLGGIIAELVCSETGIPGASFAALGAFDPFSLMDRESYEKQFGSNFDGYGTELKNVFNAEQAARLTLEGYDVDEVRSVVDTRYWEDARHRFVREEYNGLVENNKHNGVKFEVVMNTYDMLAQPLSSADGAACSHISSSCDVRWTWFPASPSTIGGHSSLYYAFKATSEFTIGWDELADVTTNTELIFLPGVQKNLACDYCESDAFCESGKCDNDLSSDRVCYGTSSGKMPTFCPSNSVAGGDTRGPCDNASECESGRCEWHSINPFSAYRCYDKIDNGGSCTEHSDCKSNYCNWLFRCS